MDSNPSTTLLQPKNVILIFGLCSTSDDWPGWSMDLNPIHHLSPAKKNEMLIFGLHSTSDDWLAGQWTRTTSATALQPKKWNTHFWIMFNFWWLAGLVDGLKPHLPPSPAKKMKYFFLDTFNFWWSAGLVDGLKPHLPPLSSQKKMKCSFSDYIQLLMIGQAGQWTQIPSATPLQPKKWNAHFWIMFNFWWLAEWSEQWTITEMQKRPPKSSKNKMFIFWCLAEDCQKTTRRLSEDHQKTSGSLLAVF